MVAVVTGGASGIGRALAVELAQQRCLVVLVDIDSEGLKQTESKGSGKNNAHLDRAGCHFPG